MASQSRSSVEVQPFREKYSVSTSQRLFGACSSPIALLAAPSPTVQAEASPQLTWETARSPNESVSTAPGQETQDLRNGSFLLHDSL